MCSASSCSPCARAAARRRRPVRPARSGTSRSSSSASSRTPAPVALEVASTGTSVAEAVAATRATAARARSSRHEVGLRQRQHARQPREALVVRRELALDRRVVGDRVRLLAHRELGGDVEHVHEQPRALDVREEVVPEAGALARALDQAGDVGDDQLALVAFEHAEHRLRAS